MGGTQLHGQPMIWNGLGMGIGVFPSLFNLAVTSGFGQAQGQQAMSPEQQRRQQLQSLVLCLGISLLVILLFC